MTTTSRKSDFIGVSSVSFRLKHMFRLSSSISKLLPYRNALYVNNVLPMAFHGH